MGNVYSIKHRTFKTNLFNKSRLPINLIKNTAVLNLSELKLWYNSFSLWGKTLNVRMRSSFSKLTQNWLWNVTKVLCPLKVLFTMFYLLPSTTSIQFIFLIVFSSKKWSIWYIFAPFKLMLLPIYRKKRDWHSINLIYSLVYFFFFYILSDSQIKGGLEQSLSP